MNGFFYGVGIGFSLIVAIGAQNAFVLKQGLKRQSVFWVCFICACSDSILIYLGITGFASVIADFPVMIQLARYFGAAFLFCYGLRSFYSAWKSQTVLQPEGKEQDSLLKIMAMCLAFTWLNPHVYLDTVILVGAISVQFAEQRGLFALGAMLSSWIFFFSLGYGAKLLLPVFQSTTSWKILDIVIGITMWTIAALLLI